LQPNWNSYFYHAVNQWDNGTPDALTLSTTATNYDYSCTPINYKLKVCNGDYGNTQWVGINKVLLMDGYIFASAARMNEYYLKSSSNDQKTYTMCHEMGHGECLLYKVICVVVAASLELTLLPRAQ
jgi:hypothetical protein